MTPHAPEIRAVWEQGKRAREDYLMHGHSGWTYAGGCLCGWCQRARARYRERYAQRKASA